MADGFYGQDMARYFHTERTATLVARAPGASQFAVTRVSRDAPGPDENRAPLPCEESFVFALQLRDVAGFRARVGATSFAPCRLPSGTMMLIDMREPPDVFVDSPFDSLVFYLNRAALDEISDDIGSRTIEGFACPALENLEDSVAFSLGTSLLSALERGPEADPLFVEHVCWALRYHLVSRWGGISPAPARGGLTPRRLAKAKDYLTAHLGEGPSLSTVAAACGLSRAHFVRAFRQSTGVPPHRWLQRYRSERARTLLRELRAPLSEVARQCGFASASHLSREFNRHFGVSPIRYRRAFEP